MGEERGGGKVVELRLRNGSNILSRAEYTCSSSAKEIIEKFSRKN